MGRVPGNKKGPARRPATSSRFGFFFRVLQDQSPDIGTQRQTVLFRTRSQGGVLFRRQLDHGAFRSFFFPLSILLRHGCSPFLSFASLNSASTVSGSVLSRFWLPSSFRRWQIRVSEHRNPRFVWVVSFR